MWLARLFGGRKAEADDEPARFAPPARPVRPMKRPAPAASARRGIHADKVADKVKSGFDPYNSGSFERNNAWERVIRR
ncbi:MAG TPA: hypothetical protein VGE08_14180 [Steroidobacter sp.]|uniref:hypothetical protein n=1 Tax=Steroidobacter sp. TaxID=1978227 RepID=UPI002ED7CCCD